MRSRFRIFLHSFLLIFTIFGWTVLPAPFTYAKQIVEDKINAQKSNVYLIEENDVLAISVFEEPDLSLSLRVAWNGTIAFPLTREIAVKGLTTYEIEQKLEKRLRDGGFLINPRVNVKLDIISMKENNEKEIFVMGAVRKPGSVTIIGKYITALEAVAMAGGFKAVAAPNRTTVMRIEDGEEKTFIVDLNKAKNGDQSLDILLKTGDTVNVPESYF